jgi:hypothetical protein
MNSKEYIKGRLQKLIKLYPSLVFSYQFDERENLHLVQVDPQSEFESNKAFQGDEADFIFEFDNLFFPESVVFVSKNSLVSVNSPEYVIESYTHEEVLPNFTSIGINDEVYLSGENNYALAA